MPLRLIFVSLIFIANAAHADLIAIIASIDFVMADVDR